MTSIPNAYAVKALSSRIDNIATELGGLSLSWNNITGKPSTFAPSAHTHKWTEITDRITKVSQLTNDAGYLTAHQSLASYYTKAEIDAKGYTTNKGTVTSVALTLPTGLACATKTITTSGTFAVTFASGYSIPTTTKQTAWDGAVSAKHTHSNKSVLDGISSVKVTHWDSAYDWYALMTTDEETADGIINKWNEVVSFLSNIAQTNTLSGIVDGINKSISDEVTRAKKAEGVNASGISTNKTNITTLQGYFTNGSAKKALQLTNARNLWGNSFNGTSDINGSIIVPNGKYISIGNIKMEYDATNKALKITNTTTNEVANLYTSGGVSAYGVGTSSSSGGGLNGSVKAYADAIRLTTENLSEIASAYSVAKLKSLINEIDGSALTEVDWSIIKNKPSTFTPSAHSHTFASLTSKPTTLAGYGITDGVNFVSTSGSGNAVTGISISGHTITQTKGTFLTSHQSLAGYATQSWVNSKGYITANDNITGNAATATKLKSTVKIFGNDFDGTKGLDGRIIFNNNLTIGIGNEIFTSFDTLFINYAARGGQNVSICNGAGNVAIGGSNYEHKLNVAGDTSVSGTLYANKLVGYLDYSYITNHPSSFPASDVYAWAKAATKPSYSWNEINNRPTVVSAFTNDANYLSKTLPAVNDANAAVGDIGFSVFMAQGNVANSNKYVDGFITSFNWGSNFCSQLFVDADPTYGMMIRHRNSSGQWNIWKEIITENNIMNQHVNTSDKTYVVIGERFSLGLNSKGIGILKFISTSGDKYIHFRIVRVGAYDISYRESEVSVSFTNGNINEAYINCIGNALTRCRIFSYNGEFYLAMEGDKLGYGYTNLVVTASNISFSSLFTTTSLESIPSNAVFGNNSVLNTLSKGNGTLYYDGNILASGGITAYSSSDIRLKKDLRKLDYLGIIKAIGGTFGFAWKKDNTRSIGWIAQHVLSNPYMRDIVETDEKGYYKINYWSPKLIATAFGAIEQVGDEVSRLKARVVFLESEVQRLSGKQDSSDKKRLDNKNINLLN